MNTPPALPITQPVHEQKRLLYWDVLRGFALLGILMSNMDDFRHPYTLESIVGKYPWQGEWTFELTGQFLVSFLFSGKFILIYAFLFGMGFQYIAERAGRYSWSTLSRRLVGLAAFGLFHILFIWFGDILFFYSIVGIVVLLMHKLKPRVMLILAGVFFGINFLLWMGISALDVMGRMIDPEASSFTEDDWMYQHYLHCLETYAHGDWWSIAKIRWMNGGMALLLTFLYGIQLLALMMAGAWVVKSGFHQKEFPKHVVRWLVVLGLVVGVPSCIAMAVFELGLFQEHIWISLVMMIPMCLGMPLMSLLYILGIYYGVQCLTSLKLWQVIGNAGRMPLTLYLMQSLICTLIYYGYGLGYYGSVDVWTGVGIGICIYVGQLVFSSVWFQFFRYGLLEWIWRCLTYGLKNTGKLEK